ncbi:MAG TPA: hypothetical protein VM075_05520 [Anaerolineae bacterium]|nr:hypothetical protein [Anaerolineae bacterium]
MGSDSDTQRRSLGFPWKQTPVVLTLLYLYMSAVGVIYTWSLLRQFGINVMDFAEATDFLLAALRQPAAVVQSSIALVAFLWITAGATVAYRRVAGLSSEPKLVTVGQLSKAFKGAVNQTVLALVVAVLVFMLPFLLGWVDGKRAMSGSGHKVAVELRSGGEASTPSCLDGDLLLIATAGDFAFFHEQESSHTYVIPVSNLAYVRYLPEGALWACPTPTRTAGATPTQAPSAQE